MMPQPGTDAYEKMIDFMRADLESGGAYTKIEMAARKRFKEQGRDFDAEFEKFKKEGRGNEWRVSSMAG